MRREGEEAYVSMVGVRQRSPLAQPASRRHIFQARPWLAGAQGHACTHLSSAHDVHTNGDEVSISPLVVAREDNGARTCGLDLGAIREEATTVAVGARAKQHQINRRLRPTRARTRTHTHTL